MKNKRFFLMIDLPLFAWMVFCLTLAIITMDFFPWNLVFETAIWIVGLGVHSLTLGKRYLSRERNEKKKAHI
jgi:general stress protein CsbA